MTLSCTATSWNRIERKLENAVAQVFVNTMSIDVKEPYKKGSMGSATGSAFFIDREGRLLTNFHVVDNAINLWLMIPALGSEKIDATIVGVCPEQDIAMLQITPDERKKLEQKLGKIPTISIGDSDKVERGEDVLGLGYPLSQTFLKGANGIVSGPEFSDKGAMLQISVPLNKGNSGGPLLNKKGEVIGINTSGMDNAQNVNYAIPINVYKLIADELKTKKLVRLPNIGIRFEANTSLEFAKIKDNPEPTGVRITYVYPDTTMERAGIKMGDVIYEFNNYRIDAYGEVKPDWRSDKASIFELYQRLPKGAQIKLVLYRDGKRLDKTITVEDPPLYQNRKIYPQYEPYDYEMFAGIVIVPLQENILEEFIQKMKEAFVENSKIRMSHYLKSLWFADHFTNKHKPYLIISTIIPGSLAAKSNNFIISDIISSVNGIEVHTLSELRQAMKKSLETSTLFITNQSGALIAHKLSDVIKNEEEFSKAINYPITPLMKELMKEGETKNPR